MQAETLAIIRASLEKLFATWRLPASKAASWADIASRSCESACSSLPDEWSDNNTQAAAIAALTSLAGLVDHSYLYHKKKQDQLCSQIRLAFLCYYLREHNTRIIEVSDEEESPGRHNPSQKPHTARRARRTRLQAPRRRKLAGLQARMA